ncbi:hypothetical protein Ahy_B05g079241 isoform C [Arachis hypogaea]|uniref:Serine protease n=1 Tax=Arachis hypogaea TaxID=3818 RepID=A0A444Z9A2_ARAHY|nr:hypothetical protein Ahy_B05g079241 isoform A [Arachis hypogaea]RYR10762.1 hypothetical protein Ahy_B05g079241 isoform B [Arachis hypogaea]RYR10763.1 hypothetical protein Ahy_B05g079241 isoform C [Arachis hypogaea]
MMKLMTRYSLCVSLLIFIPTLTHSANSSTNYLTTQQLWFSQTLDHYSPYSQDRSQFQQRYYEFLDFFRSPDGPIFMVICGEYTCKGIKNDYIAVLAKKFGAAVVSLEHRYYGKSSPFKQLTTQNLRYLSSKQALFDLAVFRQSYQAKCTSSQISESLNAKLNRTKEENPWFVFGVSYPGALSAWFRLKFPHLTCGSLASSAVVLAVYNFTEFDQQVGESAGPECKAALQETTKLIDQKLVTNGKALKASFDATDLRIDGDFLYFLADAAATAVIDMISAVSFLQFQYGNPDKVCKPLVEAKKAGDDLVDAYAKYVKEYYLGDYGASVQSYNQNYLKNTTASEDSSDRLWWFQVCTEVAYFQVAPSNDSVRSSKVDTRQSPFLHCTIWTSAKMYLEKASFLMLIQLIYTMEAPKLLVRNFPCLNVSFGSKIVFTNGSQDPWRHASKQASSPDMPSYTITCSNCGHGTDMRGCPQSPFNIEGNEKNCTSPDAVHKVRQKIVEHIDLWLSECQDTSRSCI